MVFDGSRQQIVGIRFSPVNIPQGALITNAYIEFTVDETTTEATVLSIQAQDADHAPAFGSGTNDISDRPRTVELINQLRADVGRYWLMQRVTEGHEGQSHRILISALRSGDSVEAEEWLQQHLTDVSKELQRRIAEGPAEPS